MKGSPLLFFLAALSRVASAPASEPAQALGQLVARDFADENAAANRWEVERKSGVKAGDMHVSPPRPMEGVFESAVGAGPFAPEVSAANKALSWVWRVQRPFESHYYTTTYTVYGEPEYVSVAEDMVEVSVTETLFPKTADSVQQLATTPWRHVLQRTRRSQYRLEGGAWKQVPISSTALRAPERRGWGVRGRERRA